MAQRSFRSPELFAGIIVLGVLGFFYQLRFGQDRTPPLLRLADTDALKSNEITRHCERCEAIQSSHTPDCSSIARCNDEKVSGGSMFARLDDDGRRSGHGRCGGSVHAPTTRSASARPKRPLSLSRYPMSAPRPASSSNTGLDVATHRFRWRRQDASGNGRGRARRHQRHRLRPVVPDQAGAPEKGVAAYANDLCRTVAGRARRRPPASRRSKTSRARPSARARPARSRAGSRKPSWASTASRRTNSRSPISAR